MNDSFQFWWRWLTAVTIGVVLFGLVLVVAPGFTRQLFGLLIFADAGGIDALGVPAAAYITLVHGVLGSTMFGWGIALLFIVLGPFRKTSYPAWLTLAVSLGAWFIPDTVLSLLTGFWQNAILNAVLVLLFAIPLGATYRVCRGQGRQPG